LKDPKKILIVVQRSNGDVFLCLNLIKELYGFYKNANIDILVNSDTLPLAKLLPFIGKIHIFSYAKKRDSRWKQEFQLVQSIFRKYDLSINLTASDRSVIYSLFASKRSISVVERETNKSWWKKIFLYKYYYFNNKQHIFLNNLSPLNLLGIDYSQTLQKIDSSGNIVESVKKMLSQKGIQKFYIFHPSAQYNYKIYPQKLRNNLLLYLNDLGIPIIVTGSNNKIDLEIKLSLPSHPNVIDLIGKTSLEEYIALSLLSEAYIGMDTLNMHIAASQSKQIFAIFGPSILNIWSPWSNKVISSASKNKPVQSYGNVTLFQADMPCVACGQAGCNNNHLKSDCLFNINPRLVFKEIEKWHNKCI
jgi:heptosyltransferase III